MSNSSKLIIPVYLNQKLVFDLLAMLKGGISTVTQISSNVENSSALTGKASAKFGLSEALSSLFTVGLSTEVGADTKDAASESRSYEKIHTPASLFFQLKNDLLSEGHIKNQAQLKKSSPGDFVEFEAILQRNPLVEVMSQMTKLLDMAEAFGEGLTGDDEIKGPIKALIEVISEGKTADLLAEFSDLDMSAVLTLEKEFLNNPDMTDLVDGQFKVLGKVIKKVGTKSESISLLRNSTLNIIAGDSIEQMVTPLNELDGNQLSVPNIRHEILGPAIQVIPIAIYA